MKKIIFCLMLLLIGCAPELRVFTDSDKDFDISLFTNYNWTDIKNIEANNNPLYYNELNDKRIKEAVDQQLSNKGYKRVEVGDLIVHYHIVINSYTAYREDPLIHHDALWMRPDINYYEYQEGTIIIDFMDSKTSSLVWRGYASGVLDSSKPEIEEKRIKEAVKKIFADFPGSFSL